MPAAPMKHPMNDLLDAVAEAASDKNVVSVRDVLEAIGDRSIMPFILVIAILLVSPLSGIPGVPTFSASLIILLAVQAIGGRRRLWLPEVLLRRSVAADTLKRMVAWLRKPCNFIDRHSRPRLHWLSAGPLRYATLLACVLIPLGWPLLEVLPLVSSIGAGTVSLLIFGLFSRDGVFVLAGYGMIAITLGLGLVFVI